jgi:hypothetical protein
MEDECKIIESYDLKDCTSERDGKFKIFKCKVSEEDTPKKISKSDDD